MSLTKYIYFISLLSLVLFSCSKKDEPDENIKVEKYNLSINADFTSTEVTNYSFVVLNLDRDYPLDVFYLKLGEVNLKANKITNNIIGFVIPEGLPEGVYTLSSENAINTLDLKIFKRENLSNPEQFFDGYLLKIESELNEIKKYDDTMLKYQLITKELIDIRNNIIQDTIQKIKIEYTKLSTEEKAIVGQFIHSNQAVYNQIREEMYEFNLALYNSSLVRSSCNLPTTPSTMKCLITDLMKNVTKVGVYSGLAYASGTFGLQLSAGTAGISAAVGTVVAAGFLGLGAIPAVKQAGDAILSMTSVAYIPVGEFSNIISTRSDLSFNHNEEKEIDMSFEVRNIQKDKSNEGYPLVSELLNAYESLMKLPFVKLVGLNFELPNERLGNLSIEEPSKVSIKVLDNSKVSATTINSGNVVKVKFSNSEKAQQSFRFELSYNQTDGALVKATSNATLTGNPSGTGGGGTDTSVALKNYSISIVAGNNQTVEPNKATMPMQIRLLEDNKPVGGATIKWKPTDENQPDITSSVTDINGYSQITINSPTSEGNYTYVAVFYYTENGINKLVKSSFSIKVEKKTNPIMTYSEFFDYLPNKKWSGSTQCFNNVKNHSGAINCELEFGEATISSDTVVSGITYKMYKGNFNLFAITATEKILKVSNTYTMIKEYSGAQKLHFIRLIGASPNNFTIIKTTGYNGTYLNGNFGSYNCGLDLIP
jgi:hypothetical protein